MSILSLTKHVPSTMLLLQVPAEGNHIGSVYLDYGLTLAAIIFDLALMAAIDPYALSSWAPTCYGGGQQGSMLLRSALHRLLLNGLT